MLGGLLAVLMYVGYQAGGYVAACVLLPKENLLFRLLVGSVLGHLLLMWFPALYAFGVGFTTLGHVLAFLTMALGCVGLYLWRKPLWKPTRVEGWKPLLCCVVPMTLLGVYLIWHHTLRPVDGALHTGQSGYGDMSMHLGFITSLAKQGTFPPEYSIRPGVKLGYPFLCDSISASLLLCGMPLRLAYALPMMTAMAQVFVGYYVFMERLLGRRRYAVVAFVLFFLGGGFGFAYFFEGLKDNPENFTRIFTAYYETPTNWITQNIRWVNPVADMMLPQRATLFGWAALLPALTLLHGAAFQGKRNFLALGLLAGALPMVHTHSYLALAVISVGAAICGIAKALPQERRKVLGGWALYALLAAALSVPQLLYWTIGQSSGESFIRLQFNWANINDNILWFYVKNIGITFVLLLPALLHGKGRGMWLCALPLWLLAEVIVFQPNEYDNNKLLYVVHMLSCGVVAAFLCDVYERLKDMRGRRVLAATVLLLGTLSGVLTLARESISDLELFSADHVRAARYVEENLPADAVFLTDDRHNNAIAALSGRNIVQGSPSYLYFHGVFSQETEQDIRFMLTNPDGIQLIGEKYGLDYVCLSEYERSWGADEWVFEELPLVYQHGAVSIYRVVKSS